MNKSTLKKDVGSANKSARFCSFVNYLGMLWAVCMEVRVRVVFTEITEISLYHLL